MFNYLNFLCFMSFLTIMKGAQAGASALSGIGGLFSMIGAGKRQRKMMDYQAQLQYKYQQQAAEKEFERQKDFWDLNNAYNTPSAMRSRLEDANFLPAALFGGSAPGTPSEMPSSGTPSAPSLNSGFSPQPGLDAANQAMGISRQLAEIANINSNTKLNDARTGTEITQQTLNEINARFIGTKNLGQEFSNRVASINAQIAEATKDSSIEGLKLAVDKTRSELLLNAEDLQSKHNENSLFGARRQSVLLGLQQQAGEIAILEVRRRLMESQININEQQIGLLSQLIQNAIKEGTLLGQDIDVKDFFINGGEGVDSDGKSVHYESPMKAGARKTSSEADLTRRTYKWYPVKMVNETIESAVNIGLMILAPQLFAGKGIAKGLRSRGSYFDDAMYDGYGAGF